MLLRILALASLVSSFHIVARSADWKYVGEMTSTGRGYYVFFDDQSKERTSSGVVTVWVKLLEKTILDSAMEHMDTTLVQLAANKVVTYYRPPYIRARADTSFDNNLAVIQLEVLANSAGLSRSAVLRYDLNCKTRQMRTLSGIFYDAKGDSRNSFSETGAWEDVAPDTFGELMVKVVCFGGN